ncbi:rab protein 14, partial [Genlisea aurea]
FVVRRETFDNLGGWLKEVRNYGNPNMTITLVGHKSDLEHLRAVNIEEGEKFAKKNGFEFLEASAKTGHNVTEAFSVTAAHILHKIREG